MILISSINATIITRDTCTTPHSQKLRVPTIIPKDIGA